MRSSQKLRPKIPAERDIFVNAVSQTDRTSRPRRVVWILAGLVIFALAFKGRHVANLLPQIESYVESLGPWGPAFYVLAIVVLEPLLFPNSLFGILGGVVFGLPAGLFYYCGAVYVANLLVYLLGRRALRDPVLRALESRASLHEVVRRAKHEGTPLVFWMRLIPVNPALSSYAFGAIQVPLRAVAIGSLGMLPHLILDVYLGAVATHVTEMAAVDHRRWETEGIALVLGLIAVGVVVWRVGRIARGRIT